MATCKDCGAAGVLYSGRCSDCKRAADVAAREAEEAARPTPCGEIRNLRMEYRGGRGRPSSRRQTGEDEAGRTWTRRVFDMPEARGVPSWELLARGLHPDPRTSGEGYGEWVLK